jgi:carbon monoxide dehydrogenase subunit G
MRFSNTITIKRQTSEVFAYLADFENLPRWNYAITDTRKITPGPVGVGSKYLQVRTVPKRSEETFEVIEFEPDSRLTVRGAFGPLSGQASYVLVPTDDGTRLTNAMDLQPGGVLNLVAPLATSRVRAAVATNLDKLKEILEQHTA